MEFCFASKIYLFMLFKFVAKMTVKENVNLSFSVKRINTLIILLYVGNTKLQDKKTSALKAAIEKLCTGLEKYIGNPRQFVDNILNPLKERKM